MATHATGTLTNVLLSTLTAIADQGPRPALDGYLERHAPARLVRAVLDDDELLRRAAYASYRHANGFDKLVLASSPEGHSIKLDVWWAHLSRGLEDIHNHRCSFSSHLLIGELTRPPVAADLLLGLERVRAAQVVKQADVLMLHLLVPEETAPGSLEPNLAFYGPRTAHGSSLSPAVHAALLARAGDPERALELFRLACRLDLDDLTGTSAGGLHVATMGGVWQALATGFLGLDPTGDALGIDPRLPGAWDAVELRLRYHGRRLRVRAGHDQLELATDGPVPIRLPGLPVRTVRPPGASWRRAGPAWKEEPRPSPGPSASRQGPPGPEAPGRSTGAAAGRMGEAQRGGTRPPRA